MIPTREGELPNAKEQMRKGSLPTSSGRIGDIPCIVAKSFITSPIWLALKGFTSSAKGLKDSISAKPTNRPYLRQKSETMGCPQSFTVRMARAGWSL